MTDYWRWQCKGQGCREYFETEAHIDGARCPFCGNDGRRVFLMPEKDEEQPPDWWIEARELERRERQK